MSKTDEIFQSYVNKDYAELSESAQNSYSIMYNVYKEAYGDSKTATNKLIMMIFTTVCADGQLSKLEAKFLNELADTNYTHSQLMDIVKGHGNADAYRKADSFFDSMPENIKAELLNLCLCVCAIDERISREEVNYILQLVE